MNNSLKIRSGYSSGIIAGFIASIVTIISQSILAMVGLQPAALLDVLLFTATVHIGLNTIWGAMQGIIYAKLHDAIPGEGAKKGLVYGLILYLMADLMPATYYLASENFVGAGGYIFTGFLLQIIYGLLQGILYEAPEKPIEMEDKIKHKPIAGVTAGLVGAVVSTVLMYIGLTIGIPYAWHWPKYQPITSITNIIAIEFILMFVWALVFSVIFVLLYHGIPSKKIMKGINFGIILCVIGVIRVFSWGIPYGANRLAMSLAILAYCLAFISYGIVLGYFYKK